MYVNRLCWFDPVSNKHELCIFIDFIYRVRSCKYFGHNKQCTSERLYSRAALAIQYCTVPKRVSISVLLTQYMPPPLSYTVHIAELGNPPPVRASLSAVYGTYRCKGSPHFSNPKFIARKTWTLLVGSPQNDIFIQPPVYSHNAQFCTCHEYALTIIYILLYPIKKNRLYSSLSFDISVFHFHSFT